MTPLYKIHEVGRMYDKKISVIMGVYNQLNESQLYDAVCSILSQTEKDFEFIIYDDGSVEQASEYIRKLADMDSRIVLTGLEENNGLAFALNQCINIAKGKYIARMDADDISYMERFRIQIEFLENNEEYQWCGCNAELFDDYGVWGERRMPECPKDTDFLKYSPYIHPSVMYRTSIFKEAGAYSVCPETLRCEDYELFMRFHEQGHKGYNIQLNLFGYREDRNSYNKRKLRFRVNEMKVRYKNFKKMKMLWPKGWIYVIRPIMGIFVPNQLIYKMKRRKDEKQQYNENVNIPENIGEGADVLAGSRQVQKIT